MLVGIFGDERDIHVSTLKKRLEGIGCKASVINLPFSSIEWKVDSVFINGDNLIEYDAFYIRQIPYLISRKFYDVPSKKQWRKLYNKYMEEALFNTERISLYSSIIKFLEESKFVMNPFESQFLQLLKPLQFYLLAKNNIPIPEYVVTNVFYRVEKVNKKVCKPLGSYMEVGKKRREEIREIIKERPVILQNYVHGKTIRASLLEDEFIGAVEIIHPHIDSRVGNVSYRKISLQDEVIELLFKCLNVLKLKYTEIDFIMENDKIYILDCNPSPGFMGLEEDAELPTSTKIAEYIVRQIR